MALLTTRLHARVLGGPDHGEGVDDGPKEQVQVRRGALPDLHIHHPPWDPGDPGNTSNHGAPGAPDGPDGPGAPGSSGGFARRPGRRSLGLGPRDRGGGRGGRGDGSGSGGASGDKFAACRDEDTLGSKGDLASGEEYNSNYLNYRCLATVLIVYPSIREIVSVEEDVPQDNCCT